MQEYVLDFTEARREDQIHEILQKELDFPDYYGKNLDALWDCLTDWTSDPVRIILRGTSKLTGYAKKEMEEVLRIFERAAKQMKDFSCEIES